MMSDQIKLIRTSSSKLFRSHDEQQPVPISDQTQLRTKDASVNVYKNRLIVSCRWVLTIIICINFIVLSLIPSVVIDAHATLSSKSSQRLTKRAATARLDRLWDDAIIPYEIDSNFSGDRRALFKQAMRHWENFTCIRFIERTEEHFNYIVFTERPCGCCSFVGKRGNGPQAISIGKHCDKFGIVVHELGHVVGFWHEHTRPDRDQHVQIINKNIMVGQEYNFNKLTSEEVNSLGLAYDYDSIMHYATNTFAKATHLDTILPLHGSLNTEETLEQQQQRSYQFYLQQQQQQQSLMMNGSWSKQLNRTLLNQHQMLNFQSMLMQSDQPNETNSYSQLRNFNDYKLFNRSLNSSSLDASINYEQWFDRAYQYQLPQGIMIVDGDIMVMANDYFSPLEQRQYSAINSNERYSINSTVNNINIKVNPQNQRRSRSATDADVSPNLLLVKTRPEIGQRVRLSLGDIAQTNLLYNCPKCGRTIQQANGSFHSANYVRKAPTVANDVRVLVNPDQVTPTTKLLLDTSSTSAPSNVVMVTLDPVTDRNNSFDESLTLINNTKSLETTTIDSTRLTQVASNNSYSDYGKQNQSDQATASIHIDNSINAKFGQMNQSKSFETNTPFNETSTVSAAIVIDSLANFTASNSTSPESEVNQFSTISSSRDNYTASSQQFKPIRPTISQYQGEMCEWRLTASLGERIKLIITDLDIEQTIENNSVNTYTNASEESVTLINSELDRVAFASSLLINNNQCQTDYLEIRDGYWHKSELLARICGQIAPKKAIISSSNRLLVTYKTSAAGANRRGFHAQHETICGGYIYYRGSAITDDAITIPSIVVALSSNNNTASKASASLSNQGVTFASNGTHAGESNIDLSGDESDDYRSSSGTNTNVIQSPNWPESYKSNKECIWRIKVDEQYQISLKFDSFDLENHDNCAYDYVEVRDGHNLSSNLLGRYCGIKIPEQIMSTGDKLLVRFVSDSDVNRAGFSATFEREINECQRGGHGCSYKCSNQVSPYRCECPIGFELAADGKNCEPTCGGFKNDSMGSLNSPSFPDLYPASTKCVWEIVAPLNYKITVNFSHFELEGKDHDCDYDYVDIRSKLEDGKYQKNGIYCGQRSEPFLITSVANSMRIEFNSDNSVQKSGFAAQYFTDKDECASENGGCQHICKNTIGSYQCSCHNGFVLHENGHNCVEGHCTNSISVSSGTFSSPDFPLPYPPNKECAWIFSTIAGHRIKLIFDQFDLENHQECAYDHVAVYDGLSVEESTLGRFCGSRKPLTLVSSFDKMYLLFRSDATNERRGFNATHSTVCGGRLPAQVNQNDSIYSHAEFDQRPYEKNEDCEWLIEAPENHRIIIKFRFFELEHAIDCNCDSLEIYDGVDDSVPQLARLCGNKLPPEFVSTSESMLLIFRSDDSVNAKGFSLSYTAFEANDEDQQLANMPSTVIDNGGTQYGILAAPINLKSQSNVNIAPSATTTIATGGTSGSNMQADTRTGQINNLNNNRNGRLKSQKNRTRSGIAASRPIFRRPAIALVMTKSTLAQHRVKQVIPSIVTASNSNKIYHHQEGKNNHTGGLNQSQSQRNKHKRKHNSKHKSTSNLYSNSNVYKLAASAATSWSSKTNSSNSDQYWRHNNPNWQDNRPNKDDARWANLIDVTNVTMSEPTASYLLPLQTTVDQHSSSSSTTTPSTIINKKQLNSIVDYISRQQKQQRRQQQHLQSQYVNLEGSLLTNGASTIDNQQQQHQIPINNHHISQPNQQQKNRPNIQQKLIISSVPQSSATIFGVVANQNQSNHNNKSQLVRLSLATIRRQPAQQQQAGNHHHS